MTEQLTPAHFMPYMKRPFQLRDWPHVFVLQQVEVTRLDDWARDRARRQPFNVIFSGPPDQVLREGTYTLAAEDGSSFDLYLMPVHTVENDRQNYQAAFN